MCFLYALLQRVEFATMLKRLDDPDWFEVSCTGALVSSLACESDCRYLIFTQLCLLILIKAQEKAWLCIHQARRHDTGREVSGKATKLTKNEEGRCDETHSLIISDPKFTMNAFFVVPCGTKRSGQPPNTSFNNQDEFPHCWFL